MKTKFGINPSFCNPGSRLPLFANPMSRGRVFEVFREDGIPTGEPSPLAYDNGILWPVMDGRWHGVRLFVDQGGFMPAVTVPTGSSVRLKIVGGQSTFAYWKGGPPDPISPIRPSFGGWHVPSLEALAYFKPRVLRTLDWGYQARKEKRPRWSTLPGRVWPFDPLQGEEMAIEHHVEVANHLGCHLWLNVPPRFELPVASYRSELASLLKIVRNRVNKPPILEYGNELWNLGFPVHGWLKELAGDSHWTVAAANEIDLMMEVAADVFGEGMLLNQKSHWIFVGGCLGDDGFSMNKILVRLKERPDCCGPAFYVPPFKADKEGWEASGTVPTEAQLMDSLFKNLPIASDRLEKHNQIRASHGVPFLCLYEAGQSCISRGFPWKKTAIEAQRSEAMGELYKSIREVVEKAGASICCWYSAATDQAPKDERVDPFGLLEATLDQASPLPKAVAASGL